MANNLNQFYTSVKNELEQNIMPFWLKYAPDNTHGGFIGQLENDNTLQPDAPKGLILNARLLWTFSAMAHSYPDRADYRDLAQRAYDTLNTSFADTQYGGMVWLLSSTGDVLNDEKKIYGQAFMIYALSEYAQAFNSDQAKDNAIALYELIEHHALDPQQGGYFETCHRNWSIQENGQLSDKDQPAAKSMNNHLHILEAYTNLYRIWPDAKLAQSIRTLIAIFQNHIIDPVTKHCHHFFNTDWSPISDNYTYGHDIEASWLIYEAALVLQDSEMMQTIKDLAVDIAKATKREGIDERGGLFYEGWRGQVVDFNKEWWPQAEAVVGFINAWQSTQDDEFFEAAMDIWEFIQRKIVNRTHGEWFWRVSADGLPDMAEPKISQWKCPYHNTRACLETIQRIDELKQGVTG